MTIGETIKFYRKEKDFTQGQLAELIGVSTQAVSKWETDSGMPDISQIVPLAKILDISTDKLLGFTDTAYEKELKEIRRQLPGINLIGDMNRAEVLYRNASRFFNKYPDVPDVAMSCLECYISLFSKKKIDVCKEDFLAECDRYSSSVFRYENNPDNIYKTYYLAARAYDLCGEAEKAESFMKKLPYVYGDRDYWEAEMAYADEKYDVAMEKIKKSFASKARFTSRCIRLAARIHRNQCGGGASEECLALNEYMLRLIDAFLSGGDYLPDRQMFQKTSLLTGIIYDCVNLGYLDKARNYLQELYDTRDKYYECKENSENKHCLMFPKDGEKMWYSAREDIAESIEKAERMIEKRSAE